jgi:tRNA pseudouridine55 synthase
MNVVINFNKPENISSHQAVAKVKRSLAARKAGHAGTLDPLATGVLIICLNEATKIARFLTDLDKEYVVRLKLGGRTDTYDSTGTIIEERDFSGVRESEIHAILKRLTGEIQQTPPMFSAVKIGGQPLYKLARKGMTVERPERTISIFRTDILSFDLPYVDLKVHCSKGTYIRTLCDDIGMELGVGAYMTSLQRTRVGNFRLEDSVSPADLENRENPYYSIDSVLSGLREVVLDEEAFRKAKHGVPVSICGDVSFGVVKETCPENLCENGYVRLKSPENVLFGIGRFEGGEIKIERLLNTSS